MYHSSHMHKTESKSNRANSSTDLATVGVSQHLRLKGQDSMNFQFQQHVQQMFDIPDSFFKSPEAFDSQNVTEITAQGGSTLQFRNSLETVHSFLSSDKDSTFCEMYSGFPCHEEPLYEHFTQEHSKLNFFYSQAEVACATSGNSASSTAPIRKNRIKWTKDLHEQFVAAVNSLGGPQKAKPKAVLLKMDSKSLTIFHVKSHLQKYRTAIFMQNTLKERYEERQGRDMATELQQKIYMQIEESRQLQREIRKSIQEQREIQRNLQMLVQRKQLYNV